MDDAFLLYNKFLDINLTKYGKLIAIFMTLTGFEYPSSQGILFVYIIERALY
jgi:hypothetical protein